MTADKKLLDFVVEQYRQNELVPVPGKPGRVFWPVTILKRKMDPQTGRLSSYREPVGLKETTEARAKRWLVIAEAGRAASSELGEVASSKTPEQAQQLEASQTAKENSMFDSDDDYFRYQYSQGPYGGVRSLPAARRNPRGEKGSGKPKAPPKYPKGEWRELFKKITKRASEIQIEKDCKWGTAWEKARLEIEKGEVANSNPWYENGLYLPDTTQTRSALERAPFDWSDETMVVSTLEGGRYAKNNGRYARRNGPATGPDAMALLREGTASSLKEAWAAAKEGRRAGDGKGRYRARHNPYDETPYLQGPYSSDHHPVYDQFIGQFGTGEAWTHGIVPYGRRNGGKKRR